MDATELMARINGHDGGLPKVRSVAEVYAAVLAPVTARLSQEELAAVIALGALVKARSSRLIPVLTWEQAGKIPDQGRPIL
jgi:hypothetical protein